MRSIANGFRLGRPRHGVRRDESHGNTGLGARNRFGLDDAHELDASGRVPQRGGGGRRRRSARVRLAEELRGRLPEVHDVRLGGGSAGRVSDGVQIDAPLVREMVEHVFAPDRFFANLRAPKHEVDPLVQGRGNDVALQRLAHDAHELVRRFLGPGRERHVVHRGAVLRDSEIVPVGVDEKLGERVKFRRQLFDVRGAREAPFPRFRHRAEQAVGVVEPPPLQLPRERGERLEPQQEVQHRPGGGVVRPVVKRRVRALRVLGEHREAFLELFQPLRLERADRFGEVPELVPAGHVYGVRCVVRQNPREHRVLRQVVARAPGESVERRQVFERAHPSRLPPLLRQSRRLELLLAIEQRDVSAASGNLRRGVARGFLIRKRQKHAPAVRQEKLHRDVLQPVTRVVHLVDPRRRPPPKPLFARGNHTRVQRSGDVRGGSVRRRKRIRHEVHPRFGDVRAADHRSLRVDQRRGNAEQHFLLVFGG
mmetsp:Transcript_10965/g.46826  ORF Transcript_10965/g.46826 Transcript_10965/m.46826 type:complete len:481 (+) Transcript_10965:1172-2614(+)